MRIKHRIKHTSHTKKAKGQDTHENSKYEITNGRGEKSLVHIHFLDSPRDGTREGDLHYSAG